MLKIIVTFISLLVFQTISRAQYTSSLLMVCPNLHQPDLKEVTVLRENIQSDNVFLYLTDSNGRITIQKHSLEDFNEGLFTLPNFVRYERFLQREEDGWFVYIYYGTKTHSKKAECTEVPTDMEN